MKQPCFQTKRLLNPCNTLALQLQPVEQVLLLIPRMTSYLLKFDVHSCKASTLSLRNASASANGISNLKFKPLQAQKELLQLGSGIWFVCIGLLLLSPSFAYNQP